MKNKKGISMISLIITVIIVVILLATSIAYMGNAVDNTRISAFANDLVDIEELVRTYYVKNEKFPTFDGEEAALSKAVVKSLITEGQDYFEEELNLNGDNVDDPNMGAFYKIDLGKLGVTSSVRGIKKTDTGATDESDIYVVAYPSMNVYYVKGIEARAKYYFSLSSSITSIVKINKVVETEPQDYTTVTGSQGITVKRENKKWTNKVNMYIDAYIESGETLYIKIGDGTENLLQTSQGQNRLYFQDSFTAYSNITQGSEYTLSSATLDSDIAKFNELLQNKKRITILKRKSGDMVAALNVEFSNYEVEAPVKTQAALIVSETEYNLFTIKMQDYTSGLKEVKYEYLKKYDENANIVDYYEGITRYDESYMRARAKQARVSSDGVVEIEIPKDVSSIQLMAIDEAGNSSQIDGTSYIIENTSPYVYIGINELNINKRSASFNFTIKSASDIKSANCYISTDGLNFVEQKKLNLSKESSSIYKSCVTYEGLSGVQDKLYVKVEIEYLDTKQKEIRIKQVPLNNNYIYSTSSYVINPLTGNSLSIAIPTGFTPVEVDSQGNIKQYVKSSNWNNSYFNDEKINSGVVVVDKYGNEFVWIPVKSTDDYITRFDEYPKDYDVNAVQNANNNSIKYGGFYVGRYESAFSYNDGNQAVAVRKSTGVSLNDWSSSRNSAYDGYLWNFVTYEEAKNYSQRMSIEYEYSGLKTDLLNGTQWDTLMNFLSQGGYNVTNSTSWGNHGLGTIDNPLGGELSKSGENISYYSKNIYDLAGNLLEYTDEMEDFNLTGMSSRAILRYIVRGGSYLISGSTVPVSYRLPISYQTYNYNIDIGFRVVMYFE